ncbi:MAG: hypothetical protein ACAI44_36390 [Candidatus Sericytochromatia bacterium]
MSLSVPAQVPSRSQPVTTSSPPVTPTQSSPNPGTPAAVETPPAYTPDQGQFTPGLQGAPEGDAGRVASQPGQVEFVDNQPQAPEKGRTQSAVVGPNPADTCSVGQVCKLFTALAAVLIGAPSRAYGQMQESIRPERPAQPGPEAQPAAQAQPRAQASAGTEAAPAEAPPQPDVPVPQFQPTRQHRPDEARDQAQDEARP